MIVLAHIMAMPVEEVLVPLASGAGAGAAIWLAAQLRRFRSRRARLRLIEGGGLSESSLEGAARRR